MSRTRLRHLPVAMVAAALLLAPPARAGEEGGARTPDQQVTDVGYRLATAAVGLCAAPVPLPGLAITDLSQYPASAQGDVAAALALGPDPQILAVAADSPAASAGVRVGDALLSVDGQPVPPPPRASATFDRVEAVLRMLDASAADGALELGLVRAGHPLTLRLALRRGCPTRFISAASARIGAAADGEYVRVNSAAVRFAGSDGQLAVILAHEFAHNILGHRALLAAARAAGRSRPVRETEDQADRLSVYLLDRAGYPPSAAIVFWERYRAGHPLAFFSTGDHGSAGARIALLRAEIARIERMKAAGQQPIPEFMEAGVGGGALTPAAPEQVHP